MEGKTPCLEHLNELLDGTLHKKSCFAWWLECCEYEISNVQFQRNIASSSGVSRLVLAAGGGDLAKRDGPKI